MAPQTIPANDPAVNLPKIIQDLAQANRKLAELVESQTQKGGDPGLVASLREVDEAICDGLGSLRTAAGLKGQAANDDRARRVHRFHPLGSGDGVLYFAFDPKDNIRDILYGSDDVSEAAEVILQAIARKGADAEDARLMAGGARTLLCLHRAMLAEQAARAEEGAGS